ncbi:hypothetical protein BC830DRAFT_461770 [Chytriomyces sp. MP71]|nr:hypothetical protein BC830DRAFT_461770 [Chytriomyces sp. MP71]
MRLVCPETRFALKAGKTLYWLKFLSKTSRELDVYRRTIKKLQKSKADLEGAVSKLTEHHSKNVEALKDSHAKELKDSVAKAVTESATRNKADLDKVHRDLNTANRAREVLELEMRNATKAEHQKYSDLFKAFQELAEDSKELSKMLKETTKSEQDLRAVARELTNVVKDQKLKIVELVNKNEASFSIFEEKCLAMEGQLKTLNEAKERLEALKQDLAVCRSDLVNAQAHVDALQAEKAAIEITGAECRAFRWKGTV